MEGCLQSYHMLQAAHDRASDFDWLVAQDRLPQAFSLGAHGGLGSPPPQHLIRPDPAAAPLTPAQQAEMQRILLLHSGQTGGQLGSLGLGSGRGSVGSGSDPLAAVYANVNRNFSPGDASLLSPWGLQQQQQQQAAAAQQQAAAAAKEEAAFGAGGMRAEQERVHYLPQVLILLTAPNASTLSHACMFACSFLHDTYSTLDAE